MFKWHIIIYKYKNTYIPVALYYIQVILKDSRKSTIVLNILIK